MLKFLSIPLLLGLGAGAFAAGGSVDPIRELQVGLVHLRGTIQYPEAA